MQSGNTPSLLIKYFGGTAAALAVIVLGLTAVGKASTGWSQSGPREKTLLELQVESSRQIRKALGAPVVVPPLPPITARPARDLRETAAVHEKKPARTRPSQAAMNAMAMDLSDASPTTRQTYQNYSVADRHTSY